MRHYQLIGLQEVVVDEKPSAQLLLDRMQPIANRGLRDLRHQRLCVTQQYLLEYTAETELIVQRLRSHTERITRALNNGPARCCAAAHIQSDADQSVVAGHADLGGRAVLHNVKKRDDRRRGKVDVLKQFA
jgi:hypothetical protein